MKGYKKGRKMAPNEIRISDSYYYIGLFFFNSQSLQIMFMSICLCTFIFLCLCVSVHLPNIIHLCKRRPLPPSFPLCLQSMPISSACLVFDGACPPHWPLKRLCWSHHRTCDSSVSLQLAVRQGPLSLLFQGAWQARKGRLGGTWQVSAFSVSFLSPFFPLFVSFSLSLSLSGYVWEGLKEILWY